MVRMAVWAASWLLCLAARWRYDGVCSSCGEELSELEINCAAACCWRCNDMSTSDSGRAERRTK